MKGFSTFSTSLFGYLLGLMETLFGPSVYAVSKKKTAAWLSLKKDPTKS